MKSLKTNLRYVLREPGIQIEHPPVLFLLHGVGSNEEDLFLFAQVLPPKYLVISVRAPITVGADRFAWYEVDFRTGKPVFNQEQEQTSRALLIDFIEEMAEVYAVNRDELYICGFSQGGIMSYSLGLTRPDLIKGIGILSGRLLDKVKPLVANADALRQLKVFISHGVRDTMLSVEYSRQAVLYLKKLGINPVYKEYEEGHTINHEMLADVIAWLK